MNVIVNTSPLIALDRIGQLDLLPKLFGKVVRPKAVVDELRAGQKVYGGSGDLYEAEWFQTIDDPPEMILRKELGHGETAVIALALRLKADLVVLDDLAARNVAMELGLPVTGTLGLIFAAYKKEIIPDVDAVVASLAEAGFRISNELIQSVLKKKI